MTTGLRYVDAVRLLGGQDPLLKRIDTLAGLASLGALPVVELIEAKNEVMKLGNDLVNRVRDRRSGESWTSRTARIEAAHTIIVTAAFFSEAQTLSLPFKWSNLRITKEEQCVMVVDLVTPAHPSPELSFEKTCSSIYTYYGSLSKSLKQFVSGLSFWNDLAHHKRKKTSTEITKTLPVRALERYKDYYRQLQVDVQEFAYWANMVSDEATRTELASVNSLLTRLTEGLALPVQLESLAKVQAARLQRPIAKSGDVPIGMSLPSLQDAYITPRYRAVRANEGASASSGDEDYWGEQEVRDDLPAFIAGFLSTSDAAAVPLLVLGHPGGGKSVLTEVLAAHLPSSYMPIRVPLREVSASRDIQGQIEQAIYLSTGERLAWPSLARSTEKALPVVILDGFDELLQATGSHQSAYLERIVEFQERERDAGRAVAFIVTSRIAVIERARMPLRSLLVRIEPFNQLQIERWIDIWNRWNAAYFTRANLKPFSAALIESHFSLAEQPLLLMMLALYDADDNALHYTIRGLRESELYERLLKSFTSRELRKHHSSERVEQLVEQELLSLSIVAFAMFNRGRQWVAAAEVTEDLNALLPSHQMHSRDLDLPLSPGELVFGRFFFVHSSKANYDEKALQTYEFLHATFGEFLIARLVVLMLREMASQRTSLFTSEIEDTWFSALMSWRAISTRTPILGFLQEILADLPSHERNTCLRRVQAIFHGLSNRQSVGHSAYQPMAANSIELHAHYSANLLCVGLACTPFITVSQLFPDYPDEAPAEWLKLVRLWQAGCDADEVTSLVATIQATSQQDSKGTRDLRLSYAPKGWDRPPIDLPWILDLSHGANGSRTIYLNKPWAEVWARQIHFSFSPFESILLHLVEPMMEEGWDLLSAFHILGDYTSRSVESGLRDLLWLLVNNAGSVEHRAGAYIRLLMIPRFEETELSVFNVLAADLAALDDEDAREIVSTIISLNPSGEVMALVRSLALERGVTDLDHDG
ncbi:NACHT domain-containing protein [Nonomuraea sp. NPDC050394]|uniref:NACHT domain-containing protein n=1 Tax=Nonomuraea sp. NPDC050394 TaxID=3364363 RepID=UPI0037B4863D